MSSGLRGASDRSHPPHTRTVGEKATSNAARRIPPDSALSWVAPPHAYPVKWPGGRPRFSISVVSSSPVIVPAAIHEVTEAPVRILSGEEEARLILAAFRQQLDYVLDSFEGGFLFYYFGNLDQVSHMMWRAMDPDHPAHDPVADAPYRDTIEELYMEADKWVGITLERMPEDALLVVMSDHGFTSLLRSFNINTWLLQNGYMTLREGVPGPGGGAGPDRRQGLLEGLLLGNLLHEVRLQSVLIDTLPYRAHDEKGQEQRQAQHHLIGRHGLGADRAPQNG